jgi:hypothetical protein
MNSENWLVWLISMIYEACAKSKQSPCRHRVKMHGLHYWDIHLGPRGIQARRRECRNERAVLTRCDGNPRLGDWIDLSCSL